jgi:hypothetical protein
MKSVHYRIIPSFDWRKINIEIEWRVSQIQSEVIYEIRTIHQRIYFWIKRLLNSITYICERGNLNKSWRYSIVYYWRDWFFKDWIFSKPKEISSI